MLQIKLKELRDKNNISQEELAKILNLKQSTVAMWENGTNKPRHSTLIKIATYFNISIDELTGDNTASPSTGIKIPVLGSIPAGIPIEAIEDILGEEEIPAEWGLGGKEFFALKIKGDSMEPEYRDGDIVIFNKQETCDSGDDCAVMVNGDNATFKRVERLEGGGILLKPLNPNYKTLHYTNQEILDLPVRIIGIAWELRRTRKR